MVVPVKTMAARPTQRILYVDCAPFTGGAQQSLLTLVEGVAARGWEVRVLSADRTAQGVLERCRHLAVPVGELRSAHWRVCLPGLARFAWDRLVAGRRIAQAVRNEQPTILHANGIRSGLLVPACARRAAAFVLHDRDLRVPAVAVRHLARRADQVIAISRCVASKWQDGTLASPVQVIANGFDIAAVSRAQPAPLVGFPAGSMGAVLVADFVPWKRHEAFLEAVSLVRTTGEEVVGVVVGRPRSRQGDACRQDLQARAQSLGLGTAVRFVTTASTALPWIAAADVLVSTATDEPFGRTVIEALALGRPVVAVNACGPAEVLTGCPAATLTGAEPGAIAEGLRQWLDPARRAAAREPALAWAWRYDRQPLVDAVCKLYERLATRSAARLSGDFSGPVG
jgi:glycosyltransferase involved in cell wall biosynthesis